MNAPIFKAKLPFDAAMAAIECARVFNLRRVEDGLFEVEIFSYYKEENRNDGRGKTRIEHWMQILDE